jgi:hypothetical protein
MNRSTIVIVIVLLVLWFIGAFVVVVGQFIHLLLLGALILLGVRLLRRGQKPGK